jgi:hypothetical protein
MVVVFLSSERYSVVDGARGETRAVRSTMRASEVALATTAPVFRCLVNALGGCQTFGPRRIVVALGGDPPDAIFRRTLHTWVPVSIVRGQLASARFNESPRRSPERTSTPHSLSPPLCHLNCSKTDARIGGSVSRRCRFANVARTRRRDLTLTISTLSSA